jgi:microcystin-dependent protein
MSFSSFPAGTVLPFAGSTAPDSWVLCYGQAISRTTYAHLFAVLSTTYGVGDGSTTFNLPDLRGRVAAGVDNMGGSTASRITNGGAGIVGTTLGATGGVETHTLTTAQLAGHSHIQQVDGTAGAGYAATAQHKGDTSGAAQGGTTNSTANNSTTVSTQSSGSGSAHQNTQPTMMLNYIMKT